MKILIMGCGRTGAHLAASLDAEGHDIIILDINDYSFRRLPASFRGTALVGDGTNDETLEKAGIRDVDAFVAVTEGDNRNILASQIARHVFNCPRVLLRVYDPLRRELFNNLGLQVFSPTTVFAQLLKDNLLGQER